jgi:hypothetical protein
MNTYYEIQYKTKEDPNAWFPSIRVDKNRFTSFEEACECTRKLVYEERINARKDRKNSMVVEYRVIEYKCSYNEKPVKNFPIRESLFV